MTMTIHAKSKKAQSGDCISQGALMTVNTCSCGGAGCAVCGGQGYVRPNFFAGQLLTDDDLQSLSGYVVAKNRLHNRHFFGEGVVCGLYVTCHPCGGGNVIVAPGYALDCCGNDIVLACPTELDINAMVRELRVQMLGGYDCGDPCAEKQQTDCGDQNNKDTGKDKPSPTRCYCLYIRYCEELTDPVTPYGTGEPCVNPGCEPTRVREGVRFELRCPEEEAAPDDLFVRWRRCFGDLLGAKTTFVEAPWLWTYGCQLAIAKKNIQETPTPRFVDDHVSALNTARDKLVEKLTAFSGVLPTAPGEPTTPVITRSRALQEVLEAVLDVTSLVARFLSSSTEDQRATHNSLRTTLGGLNTIFTNQILSISQEQINQNLPNTLDQAYAKALLANGNDVVREAASLTLDSSSAQTTTAHADPVARRYLAERAVPHHDLLMAAGQSASALRDWLLCQLDKTGCSTDCGLRDEVLCINLTNPNPNALANAAAAFSTGVVKLLEALFRYLQECLCCALNPPCPPCEDTAVLLACLEVKDCKVVKICDLERTFVLTPLAVRYWLPPLRLLGEVIEKLCCLPIHLKCCPVDRFQRLPLTYVSSPAAFRPPALWINLFGLASAGDAESLAVTLGALWNLIRTESLTSAVPMGHLLATSEIGGKTMAALTERIRPILAPLQGVASLLGAETPVGRSEWESLRNENETLKQRMSELEALMSTKKGKTR
jgi:hypothetical protein